MANEEYEVAEHHKMKVVAGNKNIAVASFPGDVGNVIVEIDVARLKLSPFIDQKQRNKDIDEMAASIKTQGIQSPIKVRIDPNDDHSYEVIFGNRRLKAALQLGMKTVPCVIENADDAKVLELQMVENDQRLGNNIWEQAGTLGNLRDLENLSANEIAARVGKSRQWVGRRLRLLDVPKPVVEAFKKRNLGMDKVETLMQLDPDTLVELTKNGRYGPIFDRIDDISAAGLEEFIERQFKHALKSAIFSPNDATLLPSVGPCTTCQFRQNNQADMFKVETDEINGDDRCLRASCYHAKEKAHVIMLRGRLNETDPKAVIVSDALNDETAEVVNAQRSYRFEKAKASDPGAVKLYHVGGSRNETTSYGKPWDLGGRRTTEKPKASTPAEMLKEKTARWKKGLDGEMVRTWSRTLQGLSAPSNVFDLLVSFGSKLNMSYLDDLSPDLMRDNDKDAWKLLELAQKNKTTPARAWELVLDTLTSRLNFQNLDAIDKYLVEAKRQAVMMGYDFALIEKAALLAKPEPRSVATLRAQIAATKKSNGERDAGKNKRKHAGKN